MMEDVSKGVKELNKKSYYEYSRKAIISFVKYKLKRSLDLDDVREIPSDGLSEYRDIPYSNRSGESVI